jgi:hypothetical protein
VVVAGNERLAWDLGRDQDRAADRAVATLDVDDLRYAHALGAKPLKHLRVGREVVVGLLGHAEIQHPAAIIDSVNLRRDSLLSTDGARGKAEHSYEERANRVGVDIGLAQEQPVPSGPAARGRRLVRIRPESQALPPPERHRSTVGVSLGRAISIAST